MGTRGGVLLVRLGEGADARSLCVKPFDARMVNVDQEMLAADILRAAGVRVPAARLATQAEIDDEIVPHLMAKFECTTGSWSFPDFLKNAGLFWSRADLRQMAGIPSSGGAAEHEAARKAGRVAMRAAVDAGDARAEPVAVLEFVRGLTLLQSAGAAVLDVGSYEMLGRIAAVDVLLNNFDRLPIGFDTEGNLGNVILEPIADGGVVCCAIDSCVHPLESTALQRYLARLRAQAQAPDLAAAAAALEALSGAVLLESQIGALRRGWRQGLATICELTRSGELRVLLESRVDDAVAAGAVREELERATHFVLVVAEAMIDLVGASGGMPPPLPSDGACGSYTENRLSGVRGLGTFLLETCSMLPVDAVPLFAFDFDRTLTNGFAPPGAQLEARIRGGQHTLDGLHAVAALTNSRQCIITARTDETGRVSQGKLRQVVAQLAKSQHELLKCFDIPKDDSCNRIVELLPESTPESAAESPGVSPVWKWRDVPRALWGAGMYANLKGEGPIVFGRSVYVAGYNKSLALMLACGSEATRPPTHIFFIDDAPNNAYDVHCALPGLLRRQQPPFEGGAGAANSREHTPAALPVVRALWWDLYEEEFETKTMSPQTSGPDFAYLRGGVQEDFIYGPALRHFGMSLAEIAQRAETYEHVHRERGARQAAKAACERSQGSPAAAAGASVLDRRNQLHDLLVATGRAMTWASKRNMSAP